MIKIDRLTSTTSPAFTQAARVVHDAFEPGYIAQAISPRGEHPNFHSTRYTNILRHGVLDLEAYTATTEEGVVQAIMIVAPPGTPDLTPNQETEATRGFRASLPSAIREAHDAMHASEHDLQQRSFPDNSDQYFIAFLATSPKAQGRGLGKALLAQLRQRATTEGRIVTLLTQTQENVVFYEKLGFVVKDTVSGPVRGTMIQYWSLMWTPPVK
ncbi:hypothetical protein CcaverHIS002_0411940 [Cutaneotrichosporon cavernicola]|uniref:N-acetyltransferase domain-containing protein n=1 Tax=Cutaneotrichosporon cavernicola TaxID=279322 RepID=A0AA48L5N1_9TREE|nr:uncharacterized protein CcaverHIS019_0411880 [Cutaneotrichosporon cavernicola]BEI84590.1 hypothetical protein CcaverHIS002_0411940 [Cutaneotrichosporon cavernicola]BEI92368.1 hypothetical protein CcaverHIS019_0411880 [Cutaneotrichosporon cavernicola]BEJ00136.1 hypothetical protein CcaverHIS631_0411780 [Cutaneotrichosporon cavernicola]BEJ07908.1 hypothetical protein CcaverHIS641_0411770 [Cutaneotrichosporon cavernicola]